MKNLPALKVWLKFCNRFKIAESSVPLFEATNLVVATHQIGLKIAGMKITLMHQLMAAYGQRVTVPSGWCGVVPGASILSTCDPRAATGSPLRTGAAASVSVLPGPIKS